MENTTQQPQQDTITVTDLDNLRSIVDIAASRGAFRGAELSQVGAVFDKLNRFLEAVLAQAQAQEEASNPTAPDQTQGE
jgi:hypothetical protein